MVTSLSVQIIEYIEPSNFWIGPRAVSSFIILFLLMYFYLFFFVLTKNVRGNLRGKSWNRFRVFNVAIVTGFLKINAFSSVRLNTPGGYVTIFRQRLKNIKHVDIYLLRSLRADGGRDTSCLPPLRVACTYLRSPPNADFLFASSCFDGFDFKRG